MPERKIEVHKGIWTLHENSKRYDPHKIAFDVQNGMVRGTAIRPVNMERYKYYIERVVDHAARGEPMPYEVLSDLTAHLGMKKSLSPQELTDIELRLSISKFDMDGKGTFRIRKPMKV